MKELETVEVKDLVSSLSQCVKTAQEIEVVDEESDLYAKNMIASCTLPLRKAEELRKKFVKPLNDHVKTINAFFKERTAPLDKAVKLVKQKVAIFYQEQQEIARKKEEERLAREAELVRLNITAEEKGIEPIEESSQIVEAPEKTVTTEAGKVTMRERWDFTVEDFQMVPRRFLVINPVEVRKEIAKGIRDISGLHIFKTIDTSVR